MGNLVNAFGKVTLDETTVETRELLDAILVEMRLMNLYMAQLVDEEIPIEDVKRYGE